MAARIEKAQAAGVAEAESAAAAESKRREAAAAAVEARRKEEEVAREKAAAAAAKRLHDELAAAAAAKEKEAQRQREFNSQLNELSTAKVAAEERVRQLEEELAAHKAQTEGVRAPLG